MSTKLTPKQEQFCKEYIIDLNATQAAKRAGYSEKTAKDIGCQNLAKLYLQDRIAELMKSREKRTEITGDMVVQELAKLAFADIRDLYDEDGKLLMPHELDDKTASTISSFKSSREYQGKDEEGNAEYSTIDEYKS